MMQYTYNYTFTVAIPPCAIQQGTLCMIYYWNYRIINIYYLYTNYEAHIRTKVESSLTWRWWCWKHWYRNTRELALWRQPKSGCEDELRTGGKARRNIPAWHSSRPGELRLFKSCTKAGWDRRDRHQEDRAKGMEMIVARAEKIAAT